MKVMLEEISRKKAEDEQARVEERTRADEQARANEQGRLVEQRHRDEPCAAPASGPAPTRQMRGL
ncbi:MAG TPA: hypothetical protein VGO37_14285 [Steroidobacteraceae bacterium]|nr:hypothetical protein [Steroidobacteraceae bacterium]